MDADYSLPHLVAGVLSTFPPHDKEHPMECLPMGEAVVSALYAEGFRIERIDDGLPEDGECQRCGGAGCDACDARLLA